MSGSSQPLIVFVTKSTEYTIRGYDVAFHYLVKPKNIMRENYDYLYGSGQKLIER